MSFRESAKQLRKRLSFETWKKGKNLIYRKLLKEAEEKKRRGLQEKIREIERKKASQKASTLRYFYRPMRNSSRRTPCKLFSGIRSDLERERSSAKKRDIYKTTIHQMNILQKEIEEKRVTNAQAFDAWKKQKDMKSKKEKLTM